MAHRLPMLRQFLRLDVSGMPTLRQALGCRAYSTGGDSSAERGAEKLLELLAKSPSMQQMMLASLPPSARSNPDIIKQILSDPRVKEKMVQMMTQYGLKLPTGVLEHLSSGHLEETVSRLQRIGINAAEMPQKLMAYPGLFKQLQEPKYMQAFLETTENPAAGSKYDEEVMEVVRKAQDVLNVKSKAASSPSGPRTHNATVLSSSSTSSSTPPAPGTPAAQDATNPSQSAIPLGSGSPPTPSPAATPSSPATPPPGGAPFMQLLMSDPSLAPKLANPKVQRALADIAQSPWKTIKYVFDREVMEVFGALNRLLKASGKPPLPGSK